MRITIAAVGHLKRAPEKDLCDDYVKRATKLGRQAGISGLQIVEIPESQHSEASVRKAQEAEQLSAKIPAVAKVICLDERGEAKDTVQFSKLIQKHGDDGRQELAFVVGGPDGLDSAFVSAATTTLSFGRMTWPHRLVRVMLTEQIYRAVTLMVNHPYHRV